MIKTIKNIYFNIMFGIANKLLVEDKCPNCGETLRYNNLGEGKCQGMYCQTCVDHNLRSPDDLKRKACWSFEELKKSK